MISTLQKRLQDALLSLVGPSSSFRIGSHLGRDKMTSPIPPHPPTPEVYALTWQGYVAHIVRMVSRFVMSYD